MGLSWRNGRSRHGALKGSLINHLTGLPAAILFLLIFGSGATAFPAFSLSRAWIYCGGILIGIIAEYLIKRRQTI